MEKEVSEQTDMCGQGRMLYRTHTQETSDRSVTIGILYSQHSIFSQKKKKSIFHQIFTTDTTRDRTGIL